MKSIYLFLFVGLLFSCKKKNEEPIVPVESSELVLNETTVPFSPVANGTKFFKDISYGSHTRNKIDLFLPASGSPTGLVIFIHGGGFIGGDKSIAYNNQPSQLFINQLLMQGIAFATINYQFLVNENTGGILTPMNDCKRALQFMRFHASALNINKERVVLMGNSAGSGTSLWLAFSDDMAEPNSADLVLRESTRVKGVVAGETQGTYDIVNWHNTIFYQYQQQGFSYETVKNLVTEPLLKLFMGVNNLNDVNTPEIIAKRQKCDFLAKLTSDDPEMHLDNSSINYTIPADNNSVLHHPLHAKILKDRAGFVNVPCKANIPKMNIDTRNGENMLDFVIRKVNE